MFKGLFIKKIGNRSIHEYLESPLSKEDFLLIVNILANLNLQNVDFLDYFYNKYRNGIFYKVTSKPIEYYSKYFWRTSCLDIESSSNKDKYWLDRGWSIEETKKLKSSKYGTCSLEYYKSKGYTEEESKSLLQERTKLISEQANRTKKEKSKEDPNFSKRGGYGIMKWILLGFSEEEAERKYNETKAARFEKIQEFHKENPNFYRGKRKGQIEYWTSKGFSEGEAKDLVKESQSTFTLQKCIEKYGDIDGRKRFEERQNKWSKSLFENFEKYGDGRSLQSKWASDLIDILCKELNINKPKKEKWISSKNGDLRCSYDFTYNKKIIEFNGDMWHSNPSIYNSDFLIPKSNILASVKWRIDEEKIQLAESHGYKVLVVWENEYRDNPDHITTKCLTFLKS